MEDRTQRERELVLAPNEYAYVLDTTKGHINCYVGPHKTSLAQTDSPVIFDEVVKRFRGVDLGQAIQVAATAPANWYMVLKNPARENVHPSSGVANSLVDLEVGKKIIVPGPATFSLWPGQMVRVIEGHRLRTGEYIFVRIYDVDAARAAFPDEADLVAGQKLLITGEDVSFYLPPTGVEVIPDDDGNYVREAVALQRLEYCVLIGADGKKRYLRGERVVYPAPDEHFLERGGSRIFRAIELSETTGLHVKVIAPYDDDDGVAREVGEELFLTGKNLIYFPREEHAIIRSQGRELHHAIAIPRGDGRYVLNRSTGEVRTKRGPLMLLVDPREEVLTKRVLDPREARLLFPRELTREPQTETVRPSLPASVPLADPGVIDRVPFEKPRTIVLDDKSDGAISIDIASGHAVQVVDTSGGRRVVQGPAAVLLEYDETLEALRLSTGTPKSEARLFETAFLKLAGNKVSDTVEVSTRDLVPVRIVLKYRVNFEGDDPSRWFRVENYVQLLVDHARSRIKRAARTHTVRALRDEVTDIVRDAILGARTDEGTRAGMSFDDNGMRVLDVDVLDLAVIDDVVDDLLHNATSEALRRQIEVSQKELALEDETRLFLTQRALTEERQRTRLLELELEEQLAARLHALEAKKREQRLAIVQMDDEVEAARLLTQTREHEAALKRKEELQSLTLKAHRARVDGAVAQAQAFTPHLVETLRSMSDAQLLGQLSENFSELAAVEGRGVLETAKKFLDFVPQSVVPSLRMNGSALPAPDES